MSQLAWAANASAAEMTEKRGELADQKMKLASAGATVNSTATDHFLVVGTASKGTVELVAKEAEAHMKVVKGLVAGGCGGRILSWQGDDLCAARTIRLQRIRQDGREP